MKLEKALRFISILILYLAFLLNEYQINYPFKMVLAIILAVFIGYSFYSNFLKKELK